MLLTQVLLFEGFVAAILVAGLVYYLRLDMKDR